VAILSFLGQILPLGTPVWVGAFDVDNNVWIVGDYSEGSLRGSLEHACDGPRGQPHAGH